MCSIAVVGELGIVDGRWGCRMVIYESPAAYKQRTDDGRPTCHLIHGWMDSVCVVVPESGSVDG